MKKFLLSAAILGMSVTSAHAVTAYAYDTNSLVGDQIWTGNLGMAFDVLDPAGILVTDLGVYDHLANGINNPLGIKVGIFTRPSNATGTNSGGFTVLTTVGTLVGTSATITGTSGTLIGTDRYVDVPDFTLAAGKYMVVAVGFNGVPPVGDPNGSGIPAVNTLTNTDGGRIDYTPFANNKNGYYTASTVTTLTFPTIQDTATSADARYMAGTFQFQAAAVPEMDSAAMLLVGLGALGFMARRRQAK